MGDEDIDTGDSTLQDKTHALRLQLQAQTVLATELRARLAAAVDAMETLQVTHERELSEEKETRQRLSSKLDRLAEYTQTVEEERDELRDAVLALVERVETSSRDSTWPYSRIRIPDALEPLHASTKEGTSSAHTADDYAPSVVAALRAELEKERLSHTRTHDHAELEILCLRSQLARREAELQACLTYPEHHAPLTSFYSPRSKSVKSTPSPLTPEETMRTIGLSTQRNRDMEVEIKRLSTRLEQTRARSRPYTPQLGKDLHGARPASPLTGLSVSQHLITASVHASPPSPNLEPHPRHDSPSPYTMTPRNPGTPHKRAATRISPETIPSETSHTTVPKLSNPILAEFQEDIARLASEIDALKKERQEWKDKIDTDSEATLTHVRVDSIPIPVANKTTPQPDSDEIMALRVELEAFKQETLQREAALHAEMAALCASVAEHRTEDTDTLVAITANAPGSALSDAIANKDTTLLTVKQLNQNHPSTGPQNSASSPRTDAFLNDDGLRDSEQPMDLATPPQPTIVLHDGDTINIINAPANLTSELGPHSSDPSQKFTANPDPVVDPSSIPLPDTPIGSRASSPPSSLADRAAVIRDRPPTPFAFPSSDERETGAVDTKSPQGMQDIRLPNVEASCDDVTAITQPRMC